MRATQQIPVLSLEILGVKAEGLYAKNTWSEIKTLVAAYGDSAVISAFTDWAHEHQGGDSNGYPVSEFLKSAVGRLRGTIAPANAEQNRKLDELCAGLYESGEQVFAGKQRIDIKNLLVDYSEQEVLDAYREFTSGMDDRDLKFAPKKFCEGGAVAVMIARRRRAERAKAQSAMIAAALQREQAKAAEEHAAWEAEQKAEEEALEDLEDALRGE